MSIYQYFSLLTNNNPRPHIFLFSNRHIPEEEVAPVVLDVEQQREHDPQVHQAYKHHDLEMLVIGRIVLFEISDISPAFLCHMHTLYI